MLINLEMVNNTTMKLLNQNKMKYYKILIDLKLWHLKPYKFKHDIGNRKYQEYGFLCFKLVIG
jgi:hypothetical protein